MSATRSAVPAAPVIVSITPGSAAARAGLHPGDEVVRVDGVSPRDVIEWRLATDEADVELDVVRGGVERTITVPKRAGETLGVEVQSAVFDRVRTCDNHCEFCFIYQLPKGMRRSLYLKDDDYRLSFLYGNFTTLTRFTEADLERVITEGLSPLHVSIHAIDHDVRNRMLKNHRGGMSLRWLRALLDHGIEVRGQIVVCPGINDGEVLDATLAGVLDRFPELSSVAVVPLGLSRFNTEPAMRLHTYDEANRVVDVVAMWQDIFLSVRGRRMVFAADEYYLMAGRPFPPAEAYEGFPMHEDGIGMARTFELEFDGRADTATGVRSGFFAAVDTDAPLPANPAAYTSLRSRHACGEPGTGEPGTGEPGTGERGVGVALLPRRNAPVGVLTGELGAAVIGPLVERLGRPDVRVLAVENRFFGGNTGVTGLITGDDVARVLAGEPAGHRYLLPDVCLSDDGRFLDGMLVDHLPRPVEVVATDGIALRRALEGAT
jgi:putative radical SAM enzyme (TIGR03279 family)